MSARIDESLQRRAAPNLEEKAAALTEAAFKAIFHTGNGTTEEGRSHYHDGNTSTFSFSCSNGHNFTVSRRGSCWCGWNKDVLPRVTIGGGVELRDPEVLKAMTAGEGSEFSILGKGT